MTSFISYYSKTVPSFSSNDKQIDGLNHSSVFEKSVSSNLSTIIDEIKDSKLLYRVRQALLSSLGIAYEERDAERAGRERAEAAKEKAEAEKELLKHKNMAWRNLGREKVDIYADVNGTSIGGEIDSASSKEEVDEILKRELSKLRQFQK